MRARWGPTGELQQVNTVIDRADTTPDFTVDLRNAVS